MNLDPDRYHIYPGESLPEEWYNESSGGYELPAKMWEKETLPGMLFLEFDLPEERDWFGVATESDLRYELLSGVGVRIVETDGFEGIRPYVVLVSGPGDHVIFGIKPFETPGPYDDFDPVMLDPGEGAAVELLWGFPEDDNQTMSVDVLERFISDAPTALEFHASRRSAEELFANANALAALGEIGAALEKAQESAEIYRELGRLSSAMFEEGRKVNVTMQTWITSTADAEPKFDRLGRPALVYGTLAVALLIALVGAWIYIIEPRLRE
jgi:hypothetical protein